MAIADDFSVAANGDIRYTGTTANYTVLELHRFLQDLADDAVASGDDLLDITDETPSDRATDNIITLINGYNIDDAAAEHLFDGSIAQDNGATFYRGLVVVGAVPVGTEIQIVQDNALLTNYWGSTGDAAGNGDAAANILLRIMVKTRQDDANLDGERIRVQARELGDTYAEFSVTMGAGNNTAALFTGVDLNNQTAEGTIGTYDQFVNTEGFQQLDVNGDGSDEDYYSQWTVTGGGSTPASPTINDLYEWAKYVQRRTSVETIHGLNGQLFRGITAQWNYDAEAGNEAPATNDDYVWGTFLNTGAVTGGPFVVGEKVSGGTSSAVGRVLSVDATNTSLVVATESGTWQSGEVVTGATSGATATTSAGPVGQATGGGVARILAVDDNGTTGIVWIQLLKGTNPSDNTVCYKDGDSNHDDVLTVDGAVTARSLPSTFIGVSTGSAIIGAFGIGIDPTDLTQNDQLFDLTGTLRVPPNNVTFTVSGLVSGEDRVLVGPESGGALDDGQFAVVGPVSSGATSITVDAGTETPGTGSNSETDTPSTGTLRVLGDDDIYYRVTYTGVTTGAGTMTFTGCAGLGANAADGNSAFLSYIDELAAGTSANYTAVFAANRNLFVRVRDGGVTPIRTFETPSQLTNAGGSATAIRTSDA